MEKDYRLLCRRKGIDSMHGHHSGRFLANGEKAIPASCSLAQKCGEMEKPTACCAGSRARARFSAGPPIGTISELCEEINPVITFHKKLENGTTNSVGKKTLLAAKPLLGPISEFTRKSISTKFIIFFLQPLDYFLLPLYL